MSNIGFNYGTMGLRGLAELANLENRKRLAYAEMDAVHSAEKSATIGSLAVSIIGAGKGYFSNRAQ